MESFGDVQASGPRTAAAVEPSARVNLLLLERERELAAIRAAIADGAAGMGRVVRVEAPAGIGKTSLLAAARGLAESKGMGVLAARGGQLEQSFPFGVVRQLFEPALRSGLTARLTGAAALAAPALGLRSPNVPATGEATFSVVHGLYWLAATLAAERPLALVVDDAHWSDRPSLRWLLYLTRRLEGLPLVAVLGLRPREPGAEGVELEAISTDAVTRGVEPAPLSPSGVAQLLLTRYPDADEAFVAACHATTQGNPFFIHELIGALEAEGIRPVAASVPRLAQVRPRSIARAVSLRLSGLPEGAVPLARAVATLGERAELRHAARLAGLEAATAHRVADALAEADIFAPERPLHFVHPIVRTTIRDDLPVGARGALHRGAARLLGEDGASAEVIGSHLLETEPESDPWNAEALWSAARGALLSGARENAIAFLRRALREPAPAELRPDVLLELGRTEATTGNLASAEGTLRQVLEAARDASRRAAAATALGDVLLMSDRPAEAVAVLASLVDELRKHDREHALRLESAILSIARVHTPTRALVVDRLSRYAAPNAPATPGELMLTANFAIEAVITGEPADRAADLARRALTDGRLLAGEPASRLLFVSVTRTLAIADQLDEALDWIDKALVDARQKGMRFGAATLSAFRSEAGWRRGDVLDAEADARAAMALMQEERSAMGVAVAGAFLVIALLERGDVQAAADVMAAHGLNGELPPFYPSHLLLHSRGLLRLAQGDHEAAVADLLDCGRREEAFGEHNPAVIPWRSSATVALARAGDLRRARLLAEEELARARAFGTRRAVGIALRALAMTYRGDEQAALLRESVATLHTSPARLELARSQVFQGAALRRLGHRRDAIDALRSGLDLAHRCGATALTRHAREELITAGARPRRELLTGIDALTASERRVAGMAAKGMTNRQIAEALFVTLKTVEKHLANAYAKLGISRRAELGAATTPDRD